MRRGLNRLEVAIALSVLLAVAGLAVTAVVKIRAASERTSCQNNLKQLGLAIHNYHDTNGRFPPGTMPNAALPPEQRLSFHVAIYPYVESSPVYSRVAKNEAWDSPKNVVATEGQFRTYRCPAWASEYQPGVLEGHTSLTNYVGVAGVGADAATRPAGEPGIGLFGYDRSTKKEEVKDGLENTAMLFETAHEVGPWTRGGPSTVRGVDVDDVRFGGTHIRRTWAFQKRADGFNVLLADASVRFTAPSIDPAVLAALATIASVEAIPNEW